MTNLFTHLKCLENLHALTQSQMTPMFPQMMINAPWLDPDDKRRHMTDAKTQVIPRRLITR